MLFRALSVSRSRALLRPSDSAPAFLPTLLLRSSNVKSILTPVFPRSGAAPGADAAVVVLIGSALLFVTLCCDALLGNFQA